MIGAMPERKRFFSLMSSLRPFYPILCVIHTAGNAVIFLKVDEFGGKRVVWLWLA